jgi:uncharacterized protein (TIGR02246 family)
MEHPVIAGCRREEDEMSKLLGAAAMFSMLVASVALADPPSNVGGIRSDLEKEVAIRALYKSFSETWNRHDAKALAEMWTLDGDHVEPDGHHADGRDAIEDLLTKQHKSVFKTTQLALAIADVWFITENVALVDGTYSVSGIVAPDGQAVPTRQGNLTSILLLEGGKWRIAADRLMIPAALPWRSGE